MPDSKKTGKAPDRNKGQGQPTRRDGSHGKGEGPMTPPDVATVTKPAQDKPAPAQGAAPNGAAPTSMPNLADAQKKLAESAAAAETQANAAEAKSAAAGMTAATALGEAVWLHMNVPAFKHMFLTDIEWMMLPPILLGQCRILHEQGRAVSFAAWAYLSPEAEARLQQGNPRLAPAEWKSGDRLWLVSLVAPFGHTDKALEDVKFNGLAGKSFKYHRRFPDGRAVVETVQG